MIRADIIASQEALAAQHDAEQGQHLVNAAIAASMGNADQAEASRAAAAECAAYAAARRGVATELKKSSTVKVSAEQIETATAAAIPEQAKE